MLTLSIADIVFGIEHRYPRLCEMASDYVTDAEPQYRFSLTDAMISRERRQAKIRRDDGYFESLAAYRMITKVLPRNDAMLLHAAVIEIDRRAIAFTAPSGVGKSTHIDLWRRLYGDRVSIVNGDKPIVRFSPSGLPIAYGTPWAGKEGWQRNVGLPLSDLVILRRAPFDGIRQISPSMALSDMLSAVYFGESEDEISKTMDLLDRLLSSVRLHLLDCTPTENAARVAYTHLI